MKAGATRFLISSLILQVFFLRTAFIICNRFAALFLQILSVFALINKNVIIKHMAHRPPHLSVVQKPEPALVRPLIPSQTGLDALVCHSLAEYYGQNGRDIEFYGIPEQSVEVLHPQDVLAAMQASLALRGRTFEEIERTFCGWVPDGKMLRDFTASGEPLVLPSSEQGLVDLGIRLTGREPRSLSAERDRLQARVNDSSIERNTSFTTNGVIRLIRNVDPAIDNELLAIFGGNTAKYQGSVTLGPMELDCAYYTADTGVAV